MLRTGNERPWVVEIHTTYCPDSNLICIFNYCCSHRYFDCQIPKEGKLWNMKNKIHRQYQFIRGYTVELYSGLLLFLLWCIDSSCFILAMPNRNVLAPNQVFSIIFNGQGKDVIWEQAASGFPGDTFILETSLPVTVAQFGVVLGCSVVAWALILRLWCISGVRNILCLCLSLYSFADFICYDRFNNGVIIKNKFHFNGQLFMYCSGGRHCPPIPFGWIGSSTLTISTDFCANFFLIKNKSDLGTGITVLTVWKDWVSFLSPIFFITVFVCYKNVTSTKLLLKSYMKNVKI